MKQYPGYVRYAWKGNICLFYLYPTARSEIQICSNKHEIGLVMLYKMTHGPWIAHLNCCHKERMLTTKYKSHFSNT